MVVQKQKSTACQHADCSSPATHGYRNGIRQVCENHKLAGMINKMEQRGLVKTVVCGKAGCREAARYGFASGPRRFCEKHQWPGMKLKAVV
mmetsp:Transcript_2901/g.4125  ORF Transcript_2901/g.4125 Transcript_2901/m.4125 type:complete len:91 (+) Transcript_2901:3-275(+)